MGFDITGKFIAKFDIVQRTETFRTREFVVETNEDINGRTISNFIKFQCVQDRTAIVDRINIGDTVKVHFNIKGSRWEKNGQVNYITNLDAWRIEIVNLQSSGTNPKPAESFEAGGETPDDLPF
jgi:Domain of unknown function (DUF3127)